MLPQAETFIFYVPEEFQSESWKAYSKKAPKINICYTWEAVQVPHYFKNGNVSVSTKEQVKIEVFMINAIQFHHRHIRWCEQLYNAIDTAAYEHCGTINGNAIDITDTAEGKGAVAMWNNMLNNFGKNVHS